MGKVEGIGCEVGRTEHRAVGGGIVADVWQKVSI